MSTKRICDICQKDAEANVTFDGNPLDLCKGCHERVRVFFVELLEEAKKKKVTTIPRKMDGKGA